MAKREGWGRKMENDKDKKGRGHTEQVEKIREIIEITFLLLYTHFTSSTYIVLKSKFSCIAHTSEICLKGLYSLHRRGLAFDPE